MNAARILNKCQSLTQRVHSSLRTVCPNVSCALSAREMMLLRHEAWQSQPLPALGQFRGCVRAKEEEAMFLDCGLSQAQGVFLHESRGGCLQGGLHRQGLFAAHSSSRTCARSWSTCSCTSWSVNVLDGGEALPPA